MVYPQVSTQPQTMPDAIATGHALATVAAAAAKKPVTKPIVRQTSFIYFGCRVRRQLHTHYYGEGRAVLGATLAMVR